MGFLETFGRVDVGGSIQRGLAIRGQIDDRKKAEKLEAQRNEPISIDELGLTKPQQSILLESLPNLFGDDGIGKRGEVKDALLELGQNRQIVGKLLDTRIQGLEGQVKEGERLIAEAQAKLTVDPKTITKMKQNLDPITRELIRLKGNASANRTEAEKESLAKLGGLRQIAKSFDEDLGGVESKGRTEEEVEAASDRSIRLQRDEILNARFEARDLEGVTERIKELDAEATGTQAGTFVTRGKRVSDIQLSLGIEDLRQKVKEGSATEDDRRELGILERAKTRADVLTRKLRAGATAEGREEGKRLAVIPPDIRGRTLDIRTFQSVPPGTTFEEADRIGAITATPVQMRELATAEKTAGFIEPVRILADRLITAENAVDAAKQRVRFGIGAALKSEQEAATFKDIKKAYTANLSRSIGGERGVLTNDDINRMGSGLPGFGDTKAIKDFKLEIIDFITQNAIFASKRAIAGLAPDPTFKARVKRMLDILDSLGQERSTQEEAQTLQPPTQTDNVLQSLEQKFKLKDLE